MFKSLVLFSNLILALIMNVIFGEGVKVTQNLPDRVDPGSEFVVELIINKTDVSGFAKIVQELPEGFMVEAIETQGASFTYNDNKVKLIWMALPEADEFSIKYKVTVGPDVKGKKIISGKFSYLYDNERKTVELPTNEITIGGEEKLAENIPEKTETQETETPTENIVAETKKEELTPPNVVAERKVTDLGGGKFKIELEINREIVKGFAKVQEELPSGVENASGIETKRAVFSFVDNQAKFVWMSLPNEEPIYISYNVTGSNINIEDLRNMDGTFAYLFNEETRKAKITASPDQPKPIEVAPIAEETQQSENIVENSEETKIDEPTSKLEEEIAKTTPESTPTPEPTTSIPKPETGIKYKVQICAGHNPVDVDPYFKTAFSFSEGPIMVENHEGWIKYTIGGFDNYKSARDRRNVVTAGYELPGPFVSAYNDGVRITVQEALMITNQKWFQ